MNEAENFLKVVNESIDHLDAAKTVEEKIKLNQQILITELNAQYKRVRELERRIKEIKGLIEVE